MVIHEAQLGASFLGQDRCTFLVWAPYIEKVVVHTRDPREQLIPLERLPSGYHQGTATQVQPGTLYAYILDGKKERPDPASSFQPEGVHGPSQVLAPSFSWNDQSWPGLLLRNYILYELHVGTFTPEGTFDAIIPHLDRLTDLGITALELMPVAQFPGDRNWGYDGVYPFAVQSSYGGPQGLKRLVDASHQRGLAVVLDVVYNHLGPEGNYLQDFAPYFTDRYRTPWGMAVNFDGPHSDNVRAYFIENALRWIEEFHIDALRLDAVHSIFDCSACPFLQELAAAVHERAKLLNRRIYVIAESDLNDSRLVRSPKLGGYGLDAMWNDDFHHALHTLLTNEHNGYYQDFGKFQHLAKVLRERFVYSGQPSSYRARRHGNSAKDISPHRLVVFAQNHDQVGNRMRGDRLSHLVPTEKLKLAAGVVLLSPFTPLLFMGEEFGEIAPFPYFVSHLDQATIEAVRKGRCEEFASFQCSEEPPDPQDESTFASAKLNHHLRMASDHRVLYEFFRELIRLRKNLLTPVHGNMQCPEVVGYDQQRVLLMTYRGSSVGSTAVFHFAETPVSVLLPFPEGQWIKHLDSADERWHGPGCTTLTEYASTGEMYVTLAAYSVALFSQPVPTG